MSRTLLVIYLAATLLSAVTACEKGGVEAAGENTPGLTSQEIVELADREFLIEAQQAVVYQRVLASTALEKSRDPDVQNFALHVVGLRDRALADARALMKTNDIEGRPLLLDQIRLEARNRFRRTTGPAFDAKFLSLFAADLQQIIRDFRTAAYTASNPDIRRYAARHLPSLREDFERALALQAEITES